ncbi:isochorismatase domain-containing protein 2 [Lepeophtheirus salmonis]|uniref:Isochorismatase domain-containing protein 2, mitochondrial n=1 Tax=Lepeophtheirus salmonis TaxID=72036 RepID=D3PJM3_LEPSM|nr:isochorismatase domain-containing protein 2-like [Lepeophtheirus salmonis]ADD38759.1 Isochorismatase domain-containing protein 2, mitochondrial [Lepeophtheirus salmonis]
MSSLTRVSRIYPKNVLLLLCDMQEKFRPTISYFPQVIANTKKLMEVASILKIPMVATEQYPKGLGPTVEELDLHKFEIKPQEKTQFSMLTQDIVKSVEKKESLILCGIEAHACILHTVFDLVEMQKEVFIPVDCVSSRSLVERKLAFKRLESFPNVHLTTVETLVLEFLKSSAHPDFKACQRFISLPSEDSDIINIL